MVAAANLVEVAALVGDTARATILGALMGGQAMTASELAFFARISRSTASEHLAKLVDARLISVTKQQRYRYYRIASPLVARMLESIKVVAAIEVPPRYQPRSARDAALCTHMLRPFGRSTRRGDRGRARSRWIHRPRRGRWRGDGFGGKILDRVRCGLDLEISNETNLLSPVPRLERAQISRRWRRGCGNLAAVLGTRLADPGARHAGRADHGGRTDGPL